MEANALSTYLTTITGALGDFNTGTLSTILVASLGITAGLAIAWFGYRSLSERYPLL